MYGESSVWSVGNLVFLFCCINLEIQYNCNFTPCVKLRILFNVDIILRRMEVKFKDEKFDRLEVDASFTAGFSSAIVTNYRKRLQMIRAASDERAFYALKSLHFEKLKGDRAGQYSMRLNDQWRLILELSTDSSGKIVVIIEIADYH